MSLPVISLWQPFASLVFSMHKEYETRPMPVPSTIIGKRVGIAATKVITRQQREAMKNRQFRLWLKAVGWDEMPLEQYPLGCILGTVQIVESLPMTRSLMRSVKPKERAFGWWAKGRHAWRLEDPEFFMRPISARGGQGVWYYHGEISEGRAA